ncbi:hypothetical protein [Candidatus Ruthturnera calyptogenae]|nr:hypothetical protein [Candidatus Ruthturnera calyptogenae]
MEKLDKLSEMNVMSSTILVSRLKIIVIATKVKSRVVISFGK